MIGMDFTEISTITTVGILAALFGMSLLQFSSVKKSMRIQSDFRKVHTYHC